MKKSIIFLLVFTGYSSLFAQWQYPATKTVDAKDTYWGVTYKDPYRWLEDMKDPEGGSTDVADVSWNTPQIQLVVTTAAKKAPWHSWAVVACGGMSIGHKGMVYSSKAMGLTMVDLFENETLRQTMRAEFLKKKGTTVYKVLLPDGPPPVPENR